jgi:serine/threonine protein kinase
MARPIESFYEPVAHIATTPYANIYRAHWEAQPQKPVVLKMARADLDPGGWEVAQALIHREVDALSAIGAHPNVIELIDTQTAFVLSGDEMIATPCVVLSHAATDAEALMQQSRNGRLQLRDAVKIVGGVSRGLDHVHRSHVHRDVKPDNILIRNPDRMQGVLADFGMAIPRLREAGFQPPEQRPEFARFHQGWQTPNGIIQGIPVFTGPEVLRKMVGKNSGHDSHANVHTPQTDVYALGVTTFYMMSGELPFDISLDELAEQTGKDADLAVARRVLSAHATGTVRPLEQVLKKAATPAYLAIQEPLNAALAADPDQRPSAADFGKQVFEAFERGRRMKNRRKTLIT